MDKQYTALGVVLIALLAIGGLVFAGPSSSDVNVNVESPESPQPTRTIGAQSGPDHYFEQFMLDGLTVGSSGTTLDQFRCDTAAWDPGALSTSSAPSQDISNTGAASGDPCIADFATSTSAGEWDAVCKVTGNGTSTIYLNQLGDAVTDLSASTAEVCTFQN